MIDAAEVGDYISGDTGSSDYTTAAWVTGVGKGATFTPAGGDTGKRLLFPNSGYRQNNGHDGDHGTMGYFLPTTQYGANTAWALFFDNYDPSGLIAWITKLQAHSLRCVRS